MFFYPKFEKNEQVVTRTDGINADMLMDITVYRLEKGESKTFLHKEKEFAALLLDGEVIFHAGKLHEKGKRTSLFSDLPTVAHVSKKTELSIIALEKSEVIVLSTENERVFPEKIYKKEDVMRTVSCEGKWENTAVRDVNTIFDYDNAPYSNLVVGEVLARQGRWWSYVPHYHPQPEVYYYKFEREEGFGACFIGEDAHTVKDGSAGCFPGGKTHVQVTAPGFPMYCCWMIRHLDGDPWLKTRIVDTRYEWLEK